MGIIILKSKMKIFILFNKLAYNKKILLILLITNPKNTSNFHLFFTFCFSFSNNLYDNVICLISHFKSEAWFYLQQFVKLSSIFQDSLILCNSILISRNYTAIINILWFISIIYFLVLLRYYGIQKNQWKTSQQDVGSTVEGRCLLALGMKV